MPCSIRERPRAVPSLRHRARAPPVRIIEPAHQRRAGFRYRAGMTPRTDLITASRVDLALILLPTVTWLEASVMLATSGVPAEVAARVLLLPGAQRALA